MSRIFNIGSKPLIEGNTYSTNGIIKENSGRIDMGGLIWIYNTSSAVAPYFYAKLNKCKVIDGSTGTTASNFKCNLYTNTKRNNYDFVDGTMCFDKDGSIMYVCIKNLSYTNASDFKTAMSGIYLEYDLATSTTSVGQAYECDTNLVEGQNIWNEQTQVGIIYASGSSGGTSGLMSKDFTECKPNTQYYIKTPNLITFICWYDSSKTFITREGNKDFVATSPNNAKYFKVSTVADYGTTYNRDIAIYEGSTARAYTPHIADEVATHYLHCDKISSVKVKDNSGNTLATTTPNKYLPSGQVQNNLHSSEVTCVKVDNATKYAQCKAKSSPQFNFDTEAIDLLTTTLQNEYFSVNECLCIYAEPSTTPITTPSTKTMQAQQQVEIVGKQLSVKVARQL